MNQSEIIEALKQINFEKIKQASKMLSKKQIVMIALSLCFTLFQCSAQGYSYYRKKSTMSYSSMISSTDIVFGDSLAPIEVLFLGDFTCGHCAKKMSTFDEMINSNYLSSGLVKFAFRAIPSNALSLRIAQILKCFGNDNASAYAITSVFFKNQTNLILDFDGNVMKPDQISKNIDNLAISSNIATRQQLDACFQNEIQKKEITNLAIETIKKNNLVAVPVTFINGKQENILTTEDLKKNLDKIINLNDKYIKQFKSAPAN